MPRGAPADRRPVEHLAVNPVGGDHYFASLLSPLLLALGRFFIWPVTVSRYAGAMKTIAFTFQGEANCDASTQPSETNGSPVRTRTPAWR